MNLGDKIREIMYVSRLNQNELAKELDCSQVTVSRLRRNLQMPSLRMAKRIIETAKKYKVKLNLEDILQD